jgi:hypothetical protein
MGKTIVIIIIVLLALACGALGWEVMRQQAEKQGLQDQIGVLDSRITALVNAKTEQPEKKFVTEDMLDDIGARMSSIEEQNRSLLAAQQELVGKLDALAKTGIAGAPPKKASPVDIPELSDEQQEALRELVKKETEARDMERANMIKGMVKQRFTSELNRAAEELQLTPLQKDDVSKLIDKQIDKGFKALMEAFEKGDFESARDEIRKLMAESEEEMKKILDPDQIEKLEKMMERNRQQGGPFGPDGFRPPVEPPREGQ